MKRRIAIVHDWLVTYAGAERVLEQMLWCYPEADVFSVVDFMPLSQRAFLGGRNVRTTWIQHMPLARRYYRNYLPLMPMAVVGLDVRNYDLVISSSHAVAKGVRTQPRQLHICMCYTPMRYAWDMKSQYLADARIGSGFKKRLMGWLLERIRIWDRENSVRVHRFVAISRFIAQRIFNAYGRDSTVIYPPVNLAQFELSLNKLDFYLAGSRLVPYKKIPMIIEAFNRMPDKQLRVFGDGPDLDYCRKIAGPNVQILGFQTDSDLVELMQHAKAFVFAAEEDFGILPIEAQACGTPVIAFEQGALRETIMGIDVDQPTGVFYESQSVESLMNAVMFFESTDCQRVSPDACRANAARFSTEHFRQAFCDYVEQEWRHFKAAPEVSGRH